MNKNLIQISTFLLLVNMLGARGIDVGEPAPQLSAINQNGDEIDLGSTFAEGITFVFFYPKADTPGCTAQACSLRDSFDELVSKGIKIFGISYDSSQSQKAFIEKYSLPFDLIADQDKTVSKAFDRGLYTRQAYLVQDGTVIWRDLKASTKSQAVDVKQALIELGIFDFDSMH